MECALPFLKGRIELWLSLTSNALGVEPQVLLLSALGLLSLSLLLLVTRRLLSATRGAKEAPKPQGKAGRRRQGRTSKGRQLYQRRAKEERSLISFVTSPWAKDRDPMSFRQLLCPDPLCNMCNATPAEILKVLFRPSLEDAAPSVSSPESTSSLAESSCASSALSESPPGDQTPAPPPEPCPPPPSILSPSPGLPPPAPLGDAPPVPALHSKFPVHSSPPQPRASPLLPPHHTLGEDSLLQTETTLSIKTIFAFDPILLQDVNSLRNSPLAADPTDSHARHHALRTLPASPPDATLTVPLSEPVSNLVKPHPEKSSPDRADEPATRVPTIRGTSSLGTSQLSWWQPHAKDLFLPNLLPCDFQQGLPAPHPSKASFVRDHEAHPVEPGNCSFFNPDVLSSLERQVEKRRDFLMWKEKEKKTGSLPRKLKSDHQVNSSANTSASVADEHDTAVSPHLGTSRDKPEELQAHQQHLHPETIEAAQVQSQSQHPSPLPVPSPAPLAQARLCGVCVHEPQNEGQGLTPSETQHLVWNVLQKEQETVWGLPSVVKKSQQDFCPPAPKLTLVGQSSKADVPVSVLPGDFPLSSELRKTLEHHLRKRLIQHRWGLPRRVRESLSLLNPPSDAPETPKAKCTYGLSWISSFKGQSSEGPESFKLSQSGSFRDRCSEMLPLRKSMRKGQGHSLEHGPKHHPLSDPERSSDKGLGSHSVEGLESHTRSLSRNNSRASRVSLGPKQLENALPVPLSQEFEDNSESQISGTVHNLWHPTKHTEPLPQKSHGQIQHGNSAASVSGDLLNPSKKELLEAHIKSYHMRTAWGLPTKVLESRQIFDLKNDTFKSSSISNSAPSDNLISGVDSKDGVSGSLRRRSRAFNSVPSLDHLLPATSPVGKGGQGALRQSPPDTHRELTKNVQTTAAGRRTLPSPTDSSVDKASQKQTVPANRHTLKPSQGKLGLDTSQWMRQSLPAMG
ncbi:spermatogenesis-associated protein 31D1-like [Microcebus murinus]|uniref:spermatogenesis-associated protein 31D1-like n=1 Tax=Microcebus murinus TaxID=30608 RepID=UPI003F6D00FD